MERGKRRTTLMALAALAAAVACGGGGGGSTGKGASSSDWMDGALVQVAKRTATGRETVTLMDQASGTSEQVDDEAIDEGAVEFDDAQ